MYTSSKAVVGEQAPGFKCHAIVDGVIKEISQDTYTASQHWLVLVFFPKAWSFICPTEIRSFSARLEEFLYSRSCAVAFASTDSEFCLRAWNSTSELEGGLGGVHVPLISDANHQLAKDYGVLNEVDGTAQRALFVIDPRGRLRAMSVNDVDVGRSVDEVLRLLDALTFKDEYGEGCPVDWKKGDRGIDIVSKSRVEGSVELDARRSWTDWARPKMQRAWSGTSQRSNTTNLMKLMTNPSSRAPSAEGQALPTMSSMQQAQKLQSAESAKSNGQTRPHSMYVRDASPRSWMEQNEQLSEQLTSRGGVGSEIDNEQAMSSNRAIGTAS